MAQQLPLRQPDVGASVTKNGDGSWTGFLAATLLGAFLIFQVQPVISKCVLPWFGGTPAVWTTCMLFFQVLLFGGYLYAHALRSWLPPALQGSVHLCLLIAATFMLPIQPSPDWKPIGTEEPTITLLWLLAAHVALPYFVLSSTGPLVQAWLSYATTNRSVYRLYALSNGGSLLALLSYPFFVEPYFTLDQQSQFWSLAFCGFVLTKGWLATTMITRSGSRTQDQAVSAEDESARIPSIGDRLLWIGFPSLASMMLLVVTSHVCQDIAVIPFLWVIPLAIYLISFILSFDSPRHYRPKKIALVTAVALVASQSGDWFPVQWSLPIQAVSYLIVLGGVCWICHAETASRRPATRYLTLYYALISLGGAIGGMMIAVVCPLVFHDYRELPIGVAVSMALVAVTFLTTTSYQSMTSDRKLSPKLSVLVAGCVVTVAAAMTLSRREDTIDQRRNFFGVLRVELDSEQIRLVHGNTIHGVQLLGDRQDVATSYYGTQSGIGRAVMAMQSERPDMSIGVVGLGCGVLATYGRPSDHWDMYEINPDVISVAKESFTFLSKCPSVIEHHVGDGRLLLERNTQARYDLLVLDAFSSDSIPAHLLTLEAIRLYRNRLRDDGVLAIHVSNNHLNLVPLVHRLASRTGLHSRCVESGGDTQTATRPAKWVLLADARLSFWEHPQLSVAKIPDRTVIAKAPLWTDQHHNLASVLNWFED
jgi:phosphatidylserine synthase